MVLHNSILKFNFEYIMIILRQYSKKNYRKIPKSSKIYIKCHILNCLGFNNYWILLHKINFHWRISMPKNIFPLEVFDFGVYRYSILHIGGCYRIIEVCPSHLFFCFYDSMFLKAEFNNNIYCLQIYFTWLLLWSKIGRVHNFLYPW